ncbi:hypothetical protein [Spiroplasma endosymbiont of Nebria brevicollis]|uniref:hypothetical protein n=1 Tax=Spiroplasma endosymbiont of Nebria brevicollis TaxID=3066284 RepID=UPI00313AD9E2
MENIEVRTRKIIEDNYRTLFINFARIRYKSVNNTITKSDYEQYEELIKNIKFISILKEEWKSKNFKKKELLDLNNNIPSLRNPFLLFSGSWIVILVITFIIISSTIPIVWLGLILLIPVIPFIKPFKPIISHIKNLFRKIKNKKIKYQNEAKERKMKKILNQYDIKQEDYTIWKTNYFSNIENKINTNIQSSDKQDKSIKQSTIDEINASESQNNTKCKKKFNAMR